MHPPKVMLPALMEVLAGCAPVHETTSIHIADKDTLSYQGIILLH